MSNPRITIVSVTDTRSLLFAGCGKVRIINLSTPVSPVAVFLGDASVTQTPADHTWQGLGNGAIFDVEFGADAELYAVAQSGGATTLKVIRWF